MSNARREIGEWLNEQPNRAVDCASVAKLCAEYDTMERRLTIAMRQWDNSKAEAMRLNERLQKYEPGAPMLLNGVVPNNQK